MFPRLNYPCSTTERPSAAAVVRRRRRSGGGGEEEHGGRAGAGMLGQREKERTKSLELLQHKN